MDDKTPNTRRGEEPEHMVIKTGKNTYRFTSDWTDNAGLSALLAGLVADDLMGRDNNDVKQ